MTTKDGKTGVENIKDSLISKIDSNANGAKITSVKVTYIDEKGKKVEDKNSGLDVNKEFTKTYQVAAGKTIIVTAEAIGTPVGDTTLGKKPEELAKKGKTDAKKPAKELEKAKNGEDLKTVKTEWEKSGAPGKPTEVTLLHSITEETAVGDTTKGKTTEDTKALADALEKKATGTAKLETATKAKELATALKEKGADKTKLAELAKAWEKSEAIGQPLSIKI